MRMRITLIAIALLSSSPSFCFIGRQSEGHGMIMRTGNLGEEYRWHHRGFKYRRGPLGPGAPAHWHSNYQQQSMLGQPESENGPAGGPNEPEELTTPQMGTQI